MNSLRNYVIVTGAYWSFMLTDGALRMLVLLFFHQLGYSPVELASLFLLYEFCGIITNLVGGWLAHRFGLKSTLIAGLILQSGAILMLSFLDATWALAVPFVMAAQALSGIAKDLTKMSSKTAVKFLIPEDESSKLFSWVAVLTGSKNAIKGTGFFLGAFLLDFCGFQSALQIMAGAIVLVLVTSLILLPREIGKAKDKKKLKSIFSQSRDINILSLTRVFLFGARDIWFVVGVPIFMTTVMKWSFTQVGSFMAVWVILYGIIQTLTPKLVQKRTAGQKPDGRLAVELAFLLCVIMGIMALCIYKDFHPEISLLVGLYIFGILFAINSSIHSFLILDYADQGKTAINVGFYYMANAVGRLVGTLLSGLLFQVGGLLACLTGSAVFLLITALISLKLPLAEHKKNNPDLKTNSSPS
jgi:predicted MFS family arabinose efflux permease